MTDRDLKPDNITDLVRRREQREADQPHALLRVFCDGCGLRHGSGPPEQPTITVAPLAADWTTLECPRCGCRRSTARLLTEAEANPPTPAASSPP